MRRAVGGVVHRQLGALGHGPLEQYVHMIELSANGALAGELAQIAEINERRAGETVHGVGADRRARRDAASAAAAGP